MTRINKEKGSKSARSDTVNTLIHLNLNSYFLEMFKENWTDLKEKKEKARNKIQEAKKLKIKNM